MLTPEELEQERRRVAAEQAAIVANRREADAIPKKVASTGGLSGAPNASGAAGSTFRNELPPDSGAWTPPPGVGNASTPSSAASGNHVGFDATGAAAAPGAAPPPDGSLGVGMGVGADIPPLSDVSSSSTGGTSQHIFRPEDVKASDAANREQALKQGGVLAAQAATEAQVGAIQNDYVKTIHQGAYQQQVKQADIMAGMEQRIKASDAATAALAEKASKLPYGTWLNPTAGQKVASIIGLLISGVGSGLARQPNLAASMLEQEYQNAWKEHEAGMEGAKARVTGARNAITDQREKLLDGIRTYDEFRIGATEATKAKLDAAVALAKTPEAKAAAEALKAKMDADIADAHLKNNERIKQSSYTSHRESELDSALKLQRASQAALEFQAKMTQPQRDTLKYIEKERAVRGLPAAKDNWKQAYDSSDGFTHIPDNFSIVASNLHAGSQRSSSGVLDAVAKYATGWMSEHATNEKERMFAASLGNITRAATKMGERGQTTDKDAIAYELNSGFGPNSTSKQKADALWRIRDILDRNENTLTSNNGISLDDYNRVTPGSYRLPTRPTPAAAHGVTKKQF